MLQIESVAGIIRDTIPDENETIEALFNINELLPILKKIEVYLRPKKDCPFNRGNMIVDLTFKNGQLYAIKFPLETTENQIVNWLSPLLNRMKSTVVVCIN